MSIREHRKRDEEKKTRIKYKRVYVNVTLTCNVKTVLQISACTISPFSRAVCQLKKGFNCKASSRRVVIVSATFPSFSSSLYSHVYILRDAPGQHVLV